MGVKNFLLLLVLGFFGLFSGALSQSGAGSGARSEEELNRERIIQQYLRTITQEEASRWVASQGKTLLYMGKEEMFPEIGKLMKGRKLEVIVDRSIKNGIPWLDKYNVKYTAYVMPGTLTNSGTLLLAPGEYILGPSKEKKGYYTLLLHKETAAVMYRILKAYTGLAEKKIEK